MKMTMKEKYARVIAIMNTVEAEDKDMLIEFLEDRLAKLNKSGSSSKKTKKQTENDALKETIVENLKKMGGKGRIADLLKCEELSDYSSQKISALMTQLKKTEKVTREQTKDGVFFLVVGFEPVADEDETVDFVDDVIDEVDDFENAE